ncbi:MULTISPECIES: MarR family transcriptional regulator [unclassified Sinorhizobium]|uniref:MarR family winged helix-turn-helix transcriptional regulator n=1 Tax=unclassified Sinorhizobium TaxID=2613772 RepID=UPI0024C216BA|nr:MULTISPECIES: MarR family transcriptional regulator [unclassified Sinorhizobium]MDK1378497.1 MarR family transcriptional regulator [Sinorhizobium sp. 6-70]MDK1482673.1 MarR family transcriptional regulator [Sinorhizobium sp. 6-117]
MTKADSPSHEDLMKLDNFLCFAIYSTNHAFTRVYKPLLDELDLTYPQYLVMVVLWEKDDQTVGSLGERLFLESSTLTPMLKRLEAMGYISRVRDRADERQVRVKLTESGRALREKAENVPRGIANATGMKPAELVRLKQEIATLRTSLLR